MSVTTTGSSNYSKIAKTIIAAARYTEEQEALMKSLVTTFKMEKGAATYRVPRFGTVSAAALTEGIDMADSQNLTVGYTDLTTSEAGLKIIMTDRLKRTVTEDMLRVYGKVMGRAIYGFIDEALVDLFSGFTTNTLGAASKLMDEEVIAASMLILDGNKATKPYAMVHHPYAYYTFLKTIATGAMTYGLPSDIPNKKIESFYAGTIKAFGLPLFRDSNIDVDGSGDGIGAAFSKEALSLTMASEPNVAEERDESLRATEIVDVVDFGAAELMDAYGIALTFACDKPAPTGD